MEQDELTLDPNEAEQDGETVAVEDTEAVEFEGSQEIQLPEVKLTYQEKLALATTPEEKFAIANAEANMNRRLLNKKSQTVRPAAPQSPLNVEETVLLANGMSEELLGELKAVAAVRKTSLIKAQSDPIFVAVKDNYEKVRKQESASLPASRGSGQVKARKTFNTPGLSREEHKALIASSF